MKKLILFAALYCLLPGLFAAAPVHSVKENTAPLRATDRAREHFKAHYEDARNAKWYNTGQDNMYCIFREGDKENRVFYNKKGYWKYTLQNYSGYNLPTAVKQQISELFNCYQISSVTEIRSFAIEPTYIINIENDQLIKVVRVRGDELEVQQAFEKR